MNFQILIISLLFTSCVQPNSEDKNQEKIAFVIRNMNPVELTDVFIKSNNWISDTIDVAPNSDGLIYREMTEDELHVGYSVVFGEEGFDYGYEEYTMNIPTTESFLISFHGDTVRIAAFHVE